MVHMVTDVYIDDKFFILLFLISKTDKIRSIKSIVNFLTISYESVSYTHLDVYKRQKLMTVCIIQWLE